MSVEKSKKEKKEKKQAAAAADDTDMHIKPEATKPVDTADWPLLLKVRREERRSGLRWCVCARVSSCRCLPAASAQLV